MSAAADDSERRGTGEAHRQGDGWRAMGHMGKDLAEQCAERPCAGRARGLRARRATRVPVVVVALLAAAALPIFGCSDSQKPAASAPSASASVVVLETVGPPAILNGNVFTSVQHGYSLAVPDGWQPDENFTVTPTFAVDAFLGPTDGTPVQPNISVTCVPAAITSAAAFVDSKRQFAKKFAKDGDVTESQTTLGGQPATELAYEQVTGGTTIQKTEIHEFAHACGWSLTLTHDPSKSNYDAIFQQVAKSFQFTTPGV